MTGIASALAALSPATKVFVCEPETGARRGPLAAGSPAAVDYKASFVDGAGGRASARDVGAGSTLLAGAFAVSLDETAAPYACSSSAHG